MKVLVKNTLKVIELELCNIKTGKDITEKFLEPEKYPNLYQYSDNWTEDCPGYTPELRGPNRGYIVNQDTGAKWRVLLPLWQKIILLENYLLEAGIRKPKRPAKTATSGELFAHIEKLRLTAGCWG